MGLCRASQTYGLGFRVLIKSYGVFGFEFRVQGIVLRGYKPQACWYKAPILRE